MERPREPSFKAGPVLGIAAILTLVGWVLCGMGVYASMAPRPASFAGSWDAAAVAVVAFIMAIVVWVFAFKWFAFYASFSSSEASGHGGPSEADRLHALTARRDESLRRVGELRRYANFCELEAKCWPEDSTDRAELLAYAGVARRQADETLHKWREIEREIRAERFEQIVGSRE